MRRVAIGQPPLPNDPASFQRWAIEALREIEYASHVDETASSVDGSGGSQSPSTARRLFFAACL